MSQGSGNVQRNLRLISKKQIIDQLLQRPLTYEELWEKTHVHRNELQDILNKFEEKEFIISHKISTQDDFFGSKRNKIVKRRNTKFNVLNLDSQSLAYEISDNKACEESVQQLIADPTPYYLTQYLEDYDHSSDGVLRKYGDDTIKKIKSLSVHVEPNYYTNHLLVEKVTDDVERKFPHVKEYRQELQDIFSKPIPRYDEHIEEIKKKVTRDLQLEEEKMRRLKPVLMDNLAKFIQSGHGSKLDFLVIISRGLYEEGSKENYSRYRIIWKCMKEYSQF